MSKFQGCASMQPCTSLPHSCLQCLSTIRHIHLPTTPMLNNPKSQSIFMNLFGSWQIWAMLHNTHRNTMALKSKMRCLWGQLCVWLVWYKFIYFWRNVLFPFLVDCNTFIWTQVDICQNVRCHISEDRNFKYLTVQSRPSVSLARHLSTTNRDQTNRTT
jgi:hypothetical protein